MSLSELSQITKLQLLIGNKRSSDVLPDVFLHNVDFEWIRIHICSYANNEVHERTCFMLCAEYIGDR